MEKLRDKNTQRKDIHFEVNEIKYLFLSQCVCVLLVLISNVLFRFVGNITQPGLHSIFNVSFEYLYRCFFFFDLVGVRAFLPMPCIIFVSSFSRFNSYLYCLCDFNLAVSSFYIQTYIIESFRIAYFIY